MSVVQKLPVSSILWNIGNAATLVALPLVVALIAVLISLFGLDWNGMECQIGIFR